MTTFRRDLLKLAGTLALAAAAAIIPQTRASAQDAPQPQPPTPNGKILFQSTQGGDGFVNEIYTMEADGKRQTRLTSNEFDDVAPTWSPDGSRIAFLTDRGAGYDIYVMNPDGTGERPVRDAASGGPLPTDNIQWSPEGTKLMYAVGGRVYVVEVDTNAPVQDLSAGAPSYAFDNNAVWSNDGSQLAFISNGCAGCFPDLFVMNADGTGRTQLTTTADAEFGPRWSPQTGSTSIAYGSFRGGNANVYIINADGTGDRPLTTAVNEATGATWSPDGARVAFNSPGSPSAPRQGLYTVKFDGSNLTFLTDEANGGGRTIWSPDGTRIIAHSSNADFWVDVISFPADGSTRRATNLTRTRKADDFAYSWQRLP